MDKPEYINIFSDYAKDVVKIKIDEYNKSHETNYTIKNIYDILIGGTWIYIYFNKIDSIIININEFERK